MSYSQKVKTEMCRNISSTYCCRTAEIIAMILLHGYIKDDMLYYTTENAAVARKFFKLVKKQMSQELKVSIRSNRALRKSNVYTISTKINKDFSFGKLLADNDCLENNTLKIKRSVPQKLVNKRCCGLAFIRGLFLSTGSMSEPEKTYHLEINSKYKNLAEEIAKLLNHFELHAKTIERKSNYVVYLKEGEHIASFLILTGAHTSLMELENIRIYKDIRNNINRIVNCETANTDKTAKAVTQQIEYIDIIAEKRGLNSLPDTLREVAEKRKEFPLLSLAALGEKLSPPIGKSGVNHRLRKIKDIAETLK